MMPERIPKLRALIRQLLIVFSNKHFGQFVKRRNFP